jgi:hypothetical protein
MSLRTHAILSGWPSPTDSDVKRKVLFFPPLTPLVAVPVVILIDVGGGCGGKDVLLRMERWRAPKDELGRCGSR